MCNQILSFFWVKHALRNHFYLVYYYLETDRIKLDFITILAIKDCNLFPEDWLGQSSVNGMPALKINRRQNNSALLMSSWQNLPLSIFIIPTSCKAAASIENILSVTPGRDGRNVRPLKALLDVLVERKHWIANFSMWIMV